MILPLGPRWTDVLFVSGIAWGQTILERADCNVAIFASIRV